MSSRSQTWGQHRIDRDGEDGLDRPGSESGAKVWDGLSRNLGDPALTDCEIADGTAAESGAGPVRKPLPHGSEHWGDSRNGDANQ